MRALVLALAALVLAAPSSAQDPLDGWVRVGVQGTGPFNGPGGPDGRFSDIDDGGRIYVAISTATETTFARWDGSAWTVFPGTIARSFGPGSTDVFAMAVSPAGDALYVGGNFTTVNATMGALPVANVARFDIATSMWSDMDGGVDGPVDALDTDASGQAYAAGRFVNGGGSALNRVGRWTSAGGWTGLGGGVADGGGGSVQGITVEPSGDVVAAGFFTQAFDAPGGPATPVERIARFDVSAGQWQAFADGLSATTGVTALVSDGAAVFVSGFNLASASGLSGVVLRWDGAAWSDYGGTMVTNYVARLALDGQGTLYAIPDPTQPNFESRLFHRPMTATDWALIGVNSSETFRALATNARLPAAGAYLGGVFTAIDVPGGGAVTAYNHARWDGSTWSGLIAPPPPNTITGRVLAVEDAFRSPDGVVIGGDFTEVDGQTVGRIAVYDGRAQLDDLQGGITDPNGIVHAIVARAAPGGGVIYAGGQFDAVSDGAGGTRAVENLARWTPNGGWQNAGGVRKAGGPGTVYALDFATLFPGSLISAPDFLYVAGDFDEVVRPTGGTFPARGLARIRLNTFTWEAVPGGITGGAIRALDVVPASDRTVQGSDPYNVFIGGDFTAVLDDAGAPVPLSANVAYRSSEQGWKPLGKGTNGPVYALAVFARGVDQRGALYPLEQVVYVGGDFSNVTGATGPVIPAANLAKWSSLSDAWRPVGDFPGPANGTDGPVRHLDFVEGDTSRRISGRAALTVGGDFTLVRDDVGTVASQGITRLDDIQPSAAFFSLASARRSSVETFRSLDGGTDGPVLAAKTFECVNRNPGQTFTRGFVDVTYAGGAFARAGTSPQLASPGFAKYRSDITVPFRIAIVPAGAWRNQCGPGCAVAVVQLDDCGVNFGRGGFQVVGAIRPGEVVPLGGDPIQPDSPATVQIADSTGAVFVTFSDVILDTTQPTALVVTGVDDPAAYAPNPDGRSTALAMQTVELPGAAFVPADSTLVAFVNAVTDAPAVDVALPDGTLLADGLPFDSLGAAVLVPAAVRNVEVRNAMSGAVLATLTLDLSAVSATVAVLDGFLDPAANQDGPPLGLRTASLEPGTATVSRIVDGGPGWRYLAPPVGGLTVADLARQNLVQGVPPFYPNAAPNLFTAWTGSTWPAATGGDQPLPPGQGVAWYFYDNDIPASGPSVGRALPAPVSASGGTPQEDAGIALHADGGGWNLVGNPFAQGLDVSDLAAWAVGGALASGVAQRWDAAAGTYRPTAPGDAAVSAWQAVFVENADAAALTVPLAARLAASPPLLRESATPRLGLVLESTDATTGAPRRDEAAALVFDAASDDGWDRWDAAKLRPPTPAFATLAFGGMRGGEPLLKSQESRAPFPASFEVPLHIEAVGTETELRLRWPDVAGLPADWTLALRDLATGQTVDLRTADGYTFSVGVATRRPDDAVRADLSAPAAWVVDDARLVLSVGTGIATAADPDGTVETALLAPVPNPSRGATTVRYRLAAPGPVRLDVVDLLGRRIATLADGPTEAGRHAVRWDARSLAGGVYVVRLRADGETHAQRVTLIR